MADNIKISIIIPVYNVEQYLQQCLDSVINQTLKEIEIILVDDCGTDNSIKIAEEYAKKDNRIKIIHHEENKGLGEARNSGIKIAKCEYIGFVDSDDFIEPNMYEKMLNSIEESNADMCMCGTNVIYEYNDSSHNSFLNDIKKSDKSYYAINFDGVENVNENILKNINVNAWNKIYRKEIIQNKKILFPKLYYEDAFFLNAYMLQITNICFLQDKLYNYRRRENSIMSNTFNRAKAHSIDHIKIFIEIYRYFKNNATVLNKYRGYILSLFDGYFNLAIQYSAVGDIDEVYTLAKNFLVEENLDETPLMKSIIFSNNYSDFLLNEKINRIENLLNFKTKKIKLFGIPVLKIKKYRDNKLRFYLFNFLPILTIIK